MQCIFFSTTDDSQVCPIGLEEIAYSDKSDAVRRCPCSAGNRNCPVCTFPRTNVGSQIEDPDQFREAYLADLARPANQRRYDPMPATAAPATEVLDHDDAESSSPADSNGHAGSTGTTTSTLALYRRIPDVMEAINQLGHSIAASKMFGCPEGPIGVNQGRVIAMTCMAEGITPMDFIRTYHIIGGKPAMQASAMLAEFRKRGGDHEIIENSPERAAVRLTIGKGRGAKSREFSLTWEEARLEPWPWTREIGKSALKTNWATPRSRARMLWARVVSEAVQQMMPEVNHGVHTPEEVSDYTGSPLPDEGGNGGSSGRRSAGAETATPTPPVDDPNVVDAEYTVETVAGEGGTGHDGATVTEIRPTQPATAPVASVTLAPGQTSTTTPAGIVASGGTTAVRVSIRPDQIEQLKALKVRSGVSAEAWKGWLAKCGATSATQLTADDADRCVEWLSSIPPAPAESPATPAAPAPAVDPATVGRLSPEKLATISTLYKESGVDKDNWKRWLAGAGVTTAKDLSSANADLTEEWLRKLIAAKQQPAQVAETPTATATAPEAAPFDSSEADADALGPATQEQLTELKRLKDEIGNAEIWKRALLGFEVRSATELTREQAEQLRWQLIGVVNRTRKRDEMSAWADSALVGGPKAPAGAAAGAASGN